jgi:hypothetical protein
VSMTCRTCKHRREPAIRVRLLTPGVTLAEIERDFPGTKKDSLSHHRRVCMNTPALVAAVEARQEAEAETVLEKIDRLEKNARRLGEKAEARHDIRAALMANREQGEIIKLLHELTAGPASETPVRVTFLFPPLRPTRPLLEAEHVKEPAGEALPPTVAATLESPASAVEAETMASEAAVTPVEPSRMLPPFSATFSTFTRPTIRRNDDE